MAIIAEAAFFGQGADVMGGVLTAAWGTVTVRVVARRR